MTECDPFAHTWIMQNPNRWVIYSVTLYVTIRRLSGVWSGSCQLWPGWKKLSRSRRESMGMVATCARYHADIAQAEADSIQQASIPPTSE